MSPVAKKTKGSDSKKCEMHWWKYSKSNRKKHIDLMRIQLLSPFLFSKVYQNETWVEWAKSSGLLSQKRMGAMDDLSDEEIQNTDIVDIAINSLQDEIDQHHRYDANSTDVPFLEGILDAVTSCKLIAKLEEALKKVGDMAWFKAVKAQVKKSAPSDMPTIKQDAAVFLAAGQVAAYLLAIYKGESLLESYTQDSTLDTTLQRSKEEGNTFYKNAEYSKAISNYTAILYGKPYLYIVYGNRAACYLKKKEYRSALSDGRRATTLNPLWQKGQYRYAQALNELGNLSAASRALNKAIDVCEDTKDLVTLKQEIAKKLLRLKKSKSHLSHDTKAASIDEVDEPPGIDNDMPGLDSETDSDSQKEHVPPLLTDSESEPDADCGLIKRKATVTIIRNDIDDINGVQTKAAKKKKKKKKNKKNNQTENIELRKQKRLELQTSMKEGSLALINKNPQIARHEYSSAYVTVMTKKIKNLADLITDQDRIVLRYAFAVSYLECGTHNDLKESMRLFVEINTTFTDTPFPLTYYGMGRVYHKQNLFQEALGPYREALQKHELCSVVYYPGCSEFLLDENSKNQYTIEESKPGQLQKILQNLIMECTHPPIPDALCRFHDCKEVKKSLYFTDPDFKGFVRLTCSDFCIIEFHITCYEGYKLTDNAHLNADCMTPDCFGTVAMIQVYSQNRRQKTDVKTERAARREKVSKIPYVDKTKRMLPSSEAGYEKRNKKYNERRKKKEQKSLENKINEENNGHNNNDIENNGDDNDLKAKIINDDILNGKDCESFVLKKLGDIESSTDKEINTKEDMKKLKKAVNETMLSNLRKEASKKMNRMSVTQVKSITTSDDNIQIDGSFKKNDNDDDVICNEKEALHQTLHQKTLDNTTDHSVSPKIVEINSDEEEELDFKKLFPCRPGTPDTSVSNEKDIDVIVNEKSKVDKANLDSSSEITKNENIENVEKDILDSYEIVEKTVGKENSELCLSSDSQSFNNVAKNINDKNTVLQSDDDVDNVSECLDEKSSKNQTTSDVKHKIVNEMPEEKSFDTKILQQENSSAKETSATCDDNKTFCGIDACVQVDTTKAERNKLNTKCENFRNRNDQLTNDLKSEKQSNRRKQEELNKSIQEQKAKFADLYEKSQNEKSENKKMLDKLRKENTRLQQSHDSEIKKLNTEKKDTQNYITVLQKQLVEYSAKEEAFKESVSSKDRETSELKRTFEELRRSHAREKADLEELINGLTQSQSQQAQRAQKVEITLLEVKKEGVINKYREQAMVIQNTLNQMQYWPQIPEAQNIRSVWEEYKKTFQATYEKMQGEFIALIQAVKDGQPLESMPPAKYAQPPPYPQTQMMHSQQLQGLSPHVQAQQMQRMMAAQRSAVPQPRNVSPERSQAEAIARKSPPTAQPAATTQPLAAAAQPSVGTQQRVSPSEPKPQAAASAVPMNAYSATSRNNNNSDDESDSNSESSSTVLSNKNDENKISNKMIERILLKLGSMFPTQTKGQLQYYVTEYRRRHGSMSGIKLEQLIMNIATTIRNTQRLHQEQQQTTVEQQLLQQKNNGVKSKHQVVQPPRHQAANKIVGEAKNKKVTKQGGSTNAVRRTRANHSSQVSTGWLDHPQEMQHVDVFDEGCIICFEDMTTISSLTLHCGHMFHRECISCWLNEQRTCPICRVHALLPDEYPALG